MKKYSFAFIYTNGTTVKFSVHAENYIKAWDKALIYAIRSVEIEDDNILERIYAENIIED